MYKYNIGGMTLQGHNINELKEFVEELGELAKESGRDLSKHLSDACFSIETDYQAFHGLDQDNWDTVHDNSNVYYQPEFVNGDPPISATGSELFSFEVYKDRKNCQKDFPDSKIIAYSGDEIENPTFVDED